MTRSRWAPRLAAWGGAVALILAAKACKGGKSEAAHDARPPAAIRYVRGVPFDDEVLLPWMRHYGIPGLSLAVIEGDSVQWARGYGVLEQGKTAAVTARSLFQAASISKPVAAVTTLLVLRERGVSLDDDVERHLKSWHVPANPFTAGAHVTPRLLLSHSAGVNVHGFSGYAADSPLPSLVQILDGARPANNEAIRVAAEPGTRYAYSGGGYEVTRQLLEDLTKRSYADLARQWVLDPAGMTDSSFIDPLDPGRVAAAHDAGGMLAGRWRRHPETAAAALWTTPGDLARFVIAVQRSYRGEPGALLPQDLAREMLSARRSTGVAGESIGLGFVLKGAARDASFSHGGANAGYRCFMFGLVEKRFGMVLMRNSEAGEEIVQQIVEAVLAAY